MDRLFQMILNRLMGRLINKGISAGINHVANRGRSPDAVTPDERQQGQAAKKAAQNAKRAVNIARKMLR